MAVPDKPALTGDPQTAIDAPERYRAGGVTDRPTSTPLPHEIPHSQPPLAAVPWPASFWRANNAKYQVVAKSAHVDTKEVGRWHWQCAF
jgi:hypothetical protein